MSIHSREGHKHYSPPESEQNIREANAEAHGPSLAGYLASPIRTLCESVKDAEQDFISDHDIVEAYNVFCARIRSRRSDISTMKNPLSLSNTFEKDVPLLVLCISRDIQRVLPNPFESLPRRSEQSYDTTNEDNMPPALDHLLCQHALRLMSDLFMFPALYSMFSQGQISTLLQDALSLCMPTASWAFDIERLRCTVLLMLKTQKLPLNLISPDFPSVLNAVLCITNVQEVTMSKIDGLAAINSLLQQYPILLLNLIPCLPSILGDLKIDDLAVRLAAVGVLSAFALAKHNLLDTPFPKSTFHQIAEAVHSYLTKEHSKSLPLDNSLPLIVKSAMDDNSQSFWKKKGPPFAIALVSALAILLDYRIFTSSRALKLVFSVLRATAGSRWKRVVVHSELWKILLWAFSRIPRNDEDLRNPMAQGHDLEDWNETRERAYLVLKQDVRDGIGVAFVTILLHPAGRDHEDVGKAIEIMEDLMKCEGGTEKVDAFLLLEKLMGGIGAPSQGSEGERRLDVNFSKELIDGSLTCKTFRDTILPTEIPIGDIRPLSEAEAHSFWDKLFKIWSSSVQNLLLHPGGNLPQNIFEVWQALLLVQGQLTESHQHLTTSPSFTSRVVSIVTQISSPLETPQAQTRYLNTISELWTVMKHVFTETWLPSPAERILASLLKKQFDLSNETVKNSWSRLCADLISVGIPTLLHVLHTRALSPSQEGMEVTRRLWAVLAKNAGGFGRGPEDKDTPEDDWMNLVQLLVMPFGAWNMEVSEVEIWRKTLSRTVEAGAKVSQPSHVVISVVLDILGVSKLDLLKSVPGVLDGLLSHLISSPVTNSTLVLLSLVESVLQTSYPCNADRKTWILECLRLLAVLISQALDSETMQIIAVMPNGLCKWIADEECFLSDVEHQQVVIALYSESLKRLSSLQPSLDRLHALANFLHSAFVRVQNEGLLSFEKFWRTSYHQCKGVSKKEYPLAIRACLKAWGDVCDDSFADDISLGSDSQSLDSYIIPDSQPSPLKNDVYPDVLDDNERSQGTVTPKANQALITPPPADIISEETSFAVAGFRGIRSHSKRRSDEDIPWTPKRRRVEPDVLEPSWGKPSKGSRRQALLSEPLTRVSPVPTDGHPSVQQPPTKRRREEETLSWLGTDLKRQRVIMPSSDDYDTWEANVLIGEEDFEHPSNSELADAELALEDILSPSLIQFPLRSRKREKSQTAPEPAGPDSESVSIPHAGHPLQRHQTSPLEGIQRKTPDR